MGRHFRQRCDDLQAEVEIVRELYESLLEEERWPAVLSRVTRAFKSAYSAVLTRNRLTGAVRVTASDALAPASQRAYEKHYAHLSPRSFFDRADFPVGEVFTDSLYSDYDAYLRSEIYNDFFRPLQADHLMFLALWRDPIEDKSLVVRRSRDVGLYRRDAVMRLKQIGRHITTAEGLLSNMRDAGNGLANFRKILEALGVSAFVVDRAGRIRHLTAAAEHLLGDSEIFTVVGGRLAASQAEVNRDLQAAIRDCADSIDHPERESCRTLRVNDPDGRPLRTALVSAMAWADTSGNHVPVSLIIINEPRDRRDDWAHALSGMFGLTPAESGVAVALSEGHSLSEHATQAGISVQTARTLLKRAREKTGTHTQAALVSLILQSGTVIAPSQVKR